MLPLRRPPASQARAAGYVSPAATTARSPCTSPARGSFFTSAIRPGLAGGLGGAVSEVFTADSALENSFLTA